MYKTRQQLTAELQQARKRTGRKLSRTFDAAWCLRQGRNAIQHEVPQLTLRDRLEQRYIARVERSGHESFIQEEHKRQYLKLRDRQNGLTLLQCDGWRFYSRRFGARPASLAYLVGRDDNGDFVARVPGMCETVAEAISYLEPAEVTRARQNGRRVIRQGDVYFVEQRSDNMRGLWHTNHEWNAETRTATHSNGDRSHAAVHVPFRAKAVWQNTYAIRKHD